LVLLVLNKHFYNSASFSCLTTKLEAERYEQTNCAAFAEFAGLLKAFVILREQASAGALK
jgi:hypothetical protein